MITAIVQGIVLQFKLDPRKTLSIVMRAIGWLVVIQQTADLIIPQAISLLRQVAAALTGLPVG